jgi:cytoskeletal protein RodZ
MSDNIRTETVASHLKAQRIKAGISLDDISREKRISIEILEALESADYNSLPGDAYTRGYLRSFAQALHLDPDAITQWYLNDTQQFSQSPELTLIDLRENQEYDKKKNNRFFIILVVTFLALLAIMNGLINRDDSNTPKTAIQALKPDTVFALPVGELDTAKEDTDMVSLPNPADTLKSSSLQKSSSSLSKISSSSSTDEKKLGLFSFESSLKNIHISTKNTRGEVKSFNIHPNQKQEVTLQNGWIEVNEMRGLKVKQNNKEISIPGLKFKIINGEIQKR